MNHEFFLKILYRKIWIYYNKYNAAKEKMEVYHARLYYALSIRS